MIKIFIPQKIFWEISINEFKKEYFEILEKSFSVNFDKFETEIFSWIVLEVLDDEKDIFIFLNWIFWKRYFYDFDFKTLENVFWKSFYQNENYLSDLQNIEKEIFYIKDFLESWKIFTNSKKKEIRQKVEEIFFLISGIYFHLKNLLIETEKNIFELEKVKGKADFEAMASLVVETSKTKKIELEANISIFEEKIKLFYSVISKLFIK